MTAVATATAAAMVAENERGRAMSMVTFGLSAGTVAGVPVGMLIGDSAGWRWTMGFGVAIGLLSMVALFIKSRTIPDIGDAAAEPAFQVLRSPRIAVGVAAAFFLGIASLGLYTYLLPMAEDQGLGQWGFSLVWAWGIGGVVGSVLVGKPLDRYGPKPLLILLPTVLTLSFGAVWISTNPAVWLIAAVAWGASGWASVPTLQQALTANRPDRAMPIIAFQMAAMYLGSAAGSALGSALLSSGTQASDLAAWALIPAMFALVLAAWIALGPRQKSRFPTPPPTERSPKQRKEHERRVPCESVNCPDSQG